MFERSLWLLYSALGFYVGAVSSALWSLVRLPYFFFVAAGRGVSAVLRAGRGYWEEGSRLAEARARSVFGGGGASGDGAYGYGGGAAAPGTAAFPSTPPLSGKQRKSE